MRTGCGAHATRTAGRQPRENGPALGGRRIDPVRAHQFTHVRPALTGQRARDVFHEGEALLRGPRAREGDDQGAIGRGRAHAADATPAGSATRARARGRGCRAPRRRLRLSSGMGRPWSHAVELPNWILKLHSLAGFKPAPGNSCATKLTRRWWRLTKLRPPSWLFHRACTHHAAASTNTVARVPAGAQLSRRPTSKGCRPLVQRPWPNRQPSARASTVIEKGTGRRWPLTPRKGRIGAGTRPTSRKVRREQGRAGPPDQGDP